MVRAGRCRDNAPMRTAGLYASGLELFARLGRCIESIAAPNSCAFCGADLALDEAPVCDGCHRDMPWIRARFHLEPFELAAAPLEYAFPVDAAIKRLKFNRKLFYAPAFGHLLRAALADMPDDIDAMLPMPLHWRRQAARGFNQALEISRGIRRVMALPLVDGVRRCRHTPYQSGLTAPQRKRNIRQAFRIERPLAFRHVLLVDDVITTGESCRELARVVIDAGVEKVSVLAIARVTTGAAITAAGAPSAGNE